jgi:hypothetical protein
MIIVNERGRNKMTKFKDLIKEQILNMQNLELEEETENYLRVWHKDDCKYFTYTFNDNGDLVDLY